MKSVPTPSTWLALVATLFLGLTPLVAQKPIKTQAKPDQPAAIKSWSNPEIPVEQLKTLILPLTQTEMEVQAKGWFGLVKDQVQKISAFKLSLKKKDEVAERQSEAKEALEEAREAEKAALKALQEARTKGGAEALAAAEKAHKDAQAKLEEARKLEGKARKAQEEEKDIDRKVQKTGGPTGQAKDKEEEKLLLHKGLVPLRERRTLLIERFSVVLEAWKKKGGDISVYEKYLVAVDPGLDASGGITAIMIALKGWATSKTGGIKWAQNIGAFLVVFILFLLLASFLSRVIGRVLKASKRSSVLLQDFMTRFTKRAVQFIGLIIALSYLGVNTGPVLAIIGAAGFVVGFALQGTLSNFASGILILIYRPFDVNDAINAAGVAGSVASMNLISTTIKTFDNQVMIVPNNQIWNGVITNITGSPTRRVDMVFGIGYGDDMGKAQAILEKLVGEHELVLKDPAPTIKVSELADSSVNFICRPWVKTSDYWTVYWDLTRSVKEEFDRQGVSIPFPQRDVHLIKED